MVLNGFIVLLSFQHALVKVSPYLNFAYMFSTGR